MDKAQYSYSLAGENLAMNFFSSDEAMKAWLNSEAVQAKLKSGEYQPVRKSSDVNHA
jgi:uncharacterized protein YkwD